MAAGQPGDLTVSEGDPHARAKGRSGTGRATIYDVAALAGVNPSTVSRALSRPGRVSAKTEEKVRAAAAELSFRMNPLARALPTGRTMTLAVVVGDITNPVVFGTIRGAEHTAAAAGYTMIIAESQESGDTEASTIERLVPSVDGIVLATTRLVPSAISALADRLPLVVINAEVPGVHGVVFDLEQSVTALIDHLAGLGHERLAFISGPATSWSGQQRWRALLREAERRGLSIVEIPASSPTIDGGADALRRVQAAHVTAAIAFNDLVAIGLMRQAAAVGVDVPGDLSVTGFDDIVGADLIVPGLTTIRSPLNAAGDRAVTTLLARLDQGEWPDAPAPLQTELVVRESTGPAPR